MLTRRHILQMSAAATAATAFPAFRALAQPVPLRRNIHEMDLDDPVLVTFRDFVTRMKDPSQSGQPVNWVNFANIHGTSAGFNFCPHGNWYFLPWHRAYVQMYEQTARDLTGDTEFAMPYWDWTARPDFPAALGDETFDGQPNPLFVPGRLMTTGDTIDPGVSGQAVLDAVMASASFEEFGSSRVFGQDSSDPMWVKIPGTQGELEFNPHNNIHNDINGPFMGGFRSPQDPVFQLHHGNIDRLWDAWNRAGGANATTPLWLDTVFENNFIDPAGALYSRAVNELLDVVPLGYTYVPAPGPEPEPQPEPTPTDPGRHLYLSLLFGAPLGLEAGFVPPTATAGSVTASPGETATVSLETGALNLSAASAETSGVLESAGLTPRRAKVFLRKLMPDAPDVTRVRVFVNAPEATAETPTERNPNYVTTIGFFGLEPGGTMRMVGMEHGEGTEPSVQLNLPPAALEPGAQRVTLQLVPVPRAEGDEAGAVTVTQVELAVV